MWINACMSAFSTSSGTYTSVDRLSVERTRLALQLAHEFALYYVFSIGMTLYNKYLFTAYGMAFPLSITCMHMIFRMPLAALAMRIYGVRMPRFSRRVLWLYIAPIGFTTALDIGLSNVAFLFVSVTYYTIIKSSVPAWVLLCSVALRLQRPSFQLAAVVITIIAGISLASVPAAEAAAPGVSNATVTDVEAHTSHDVAVGRLARRLVELATGRRLESDTADLAPLVPAPSPADEAMGLVILLGASLCAGLRWSFTQLLLAQMSGAADEGRRGGGGGGGGAERVHPFPLLLMTSPFGTAMLLPIAWLLERDTLHAYNASRSDSWPLALALSLAGGVAAFFMLLFEMRIVQLSSGLTLSVAGVLKELFTIVSAVLVMGDTLTRHNAVGLAVCFVGVAGYQRIKSAEGLASEQSARLNPSCSELINSCPEERSLSPQSAYSAGGSK